MVLFDLLLLPFGFLLFPYFPDIIDLVSFFVV